MSTHNIPFNIKKKITLNHPKSVMYFFQGTQERVQNSRGKRDISARATEVLLYCLKEPLSPKHPTNQFILY